MQTNPHCLTQLGIRLVAIHSSAHAQCDNTRRMRMLLRGIFADGRVDARDEQAVAMLKALADAEHNRNLEADADVEAGQKCLTRAEDLWHETARKR